MHAKRLANRPRLIGGILITLTILGAGCGAPGSLPGLYRNPVSTVATPTASAIRAATAASTAPPTVALAAGPTTRAPAAGRAPCIIVVRTPAPNAPTASAMGTALPRQVDPHVEICASATRLRVGDALTVLAQPVDIGMPDFIVDAGDNGSADLRQMVEVRYDNRQTGVFAASQVLEFVSAQGSTTQLVISLRARAAGTTELVVGARGEIHYGVPGPAGPGSAWSQPITITVTS